MPRLACHAGGPLCPSTPPALSAADSRYELPVCATLSRTGADSWSSVAMYSTGRAGTRSRARAANARPSVSGRTTSTTSRLTIGECSLIRSRASSPVRALSTQYWGPWRPFTTNCRRRSSSSTKRMTAESVGVRTASRPGRTNGRHLPCVAPGGSSQRLSHHAGRMVRLGPPSNAQRRLLPSVCQDGLAVVADARVGGDRAGAVRAPSLVHRIHGEAGHQEQQKGQGTQHQPGEDSEDQ